MITDYILCLDASSETTSCASKLAAVCAGSSRHYQPFTDEQCLMKMTNPEKFIIVGASSSDDFPSEFVRDFTKRFSKKFTQSQKNDVKDIYLFMDATTVITQEIILSVQKIANKLYDHGFCAVTVHALIPPDEMDPSMEVTIQFADADSGFYRFLPMMKAHILNAYYLPEGSKQRLSSFQDQPRKYYREIDAITKEAYYFLEHAHPIESLNLPQYLFIPHETAEVRRDRIRLSPAKIAYDHECQLRNDVAEKIHEFARASNKNVDKKVGVALQVLSERVSHSAYDTWRSQISRTRKKLKLGGAIKKGDKISLFLKKVEHCKIKKKNEGTMHQLFHAENPGVFIEEHIRVKNTLKSIAKERDQLMANLMTEIQQLSTSCFGFFNAYEIETKQEKITALKQLSFDKLSELQAAAKKALSNSRVMRSVKTSRTETLLNKIMRIDHYASAKHLQKIN